LEHNDLIRHSIARLAAEDGITYEAGIIRYQKVIDILKNAIGKTTETSNSHSKMLEIRSNWSQYCDLAPELKRVPVGTLIITRTTFESKSPIISSLRDAYNKNPRAIKMATSAENDLANFNSRLDKGLIPHEEVTVVAEAIGPKNPTKGILARSN
jgi:hypothetical protein